MYTFLQCVICDCFMEKIYEDDRSYVWVCEECGYKEWTHDFTDAEWLMVDHYRQNVLKRRF